MIDCGWVWVVWLLWCVWCGGMGLVGDFVCGADASMCDGHLIAAVAVCSEYAALSDVPFAARCGRFAAPPGV